jgi:putative NADH-flavin reductase
MTAKLILITGATGNVGGRLLPLLVEDGWRVRCLARQPERLSSRVPARVEVVPGDVLDAASLSPTMQGVEAAYYLVHSMGATGDFEEQDRLAADNFASAAAAAGVQRIIYLGGLGEDEAELSARLRSRHEVGERLRAHGVPVIELRASIIIGSGSLSEGTLFDFSTVTNATAWQIANDDVMGGVSSSRISVTNGVAVFRGELSLENYGGFASVRSLPARFDLAGGDAFVIRVRGDGRRYKFTARTDRTFDSPIYQASFPTKPGEWTDLRLPMKDFVPTFRGRVLSGEPLLDPAKVTSARTEAELRRNLLESDVTRWSHLPGERHAGGGQPELSRWARQAPCLEVYSQAAGVARGPSSGQRCGSRSFAPAGSTWSGVAANV